MHVTRHYSMHECCRFRSGGSTIRPPLLPVCSLIFLPDKSTNTTKQLKPGKVIFYSECINSIPEGSSRGIKNEQVLIGVSGSVAISKLSYSKRESEIHVLYDYDYC